MNEKLILQPENDLNNIKKCNCNSIIKWIRTGEGTIIRSCQECFTIFYNPKDEQEINHIKYKYEYMIELRKRGML